MMAVPFLAGLRTSPPVLVMMAGGWAVALIANLSGRAGLLSHEMVVEGSSALLPALLLFGLTWQLMIVAMMLPTALPVIRLFDALAARHPQPRACRLAFVAGYAAAWTVFGALALVGDAAIHRTVGGLPWLAARPELLAAGALMLAGAFQFSELKNRCLTVCRHPAAFLLVHYRRGPREAFRTGARHGIFCIGCCWALMLVLFAVGMANLLWMAALTLVMVVEKTALRGRQFAAPTGIVLMASGLATLVTS